MGMYLNPGNSGFTRIRNDIYVDKSGLISLINETIETPRFLTCVSRPRRFGKSFAAKMLCAYYDKTCNSSMLFDDLSIARDVKINGTYRQHLNQYNVICLDMTNVLGKAEPHDIVPFIQNSVTNELLDTYPDLKAGNVFDETLLHAVELTGSKFIMIIDEWDAPIRETPEFQKAYLDFLRTLFKSSGTTDQIFAAVYMTGILPIRKDGSQSAISDFKEFTILDPGKYTKFTGFTEAEVHRLCDTYNMSFHEAKNWYDGYFFDNRYSMYNPYSVICAMQSRKYRSYWKKTAAAEALLTYIDMDEEGLQDDIIRLISGELIEVDTEGFENDFETFKNKDDVLTLLIHLGYLTFKEEENGTGIAFIPNNEIRGEFSKILRRGRHTSLLRLIRKSDKLLSDTLKGDADTVAKTIALVHDSNCAPQFYNNEQALRSTVRCAYITCVDQYIKIEELPSGHGYADIVYIPRRRSPLPALIIELKWNKTEKGAIAQIKERNYPAVLEGFEGELVLVGINYNEKTKRHTCSIEKISGEPTAKNAPPCEQ
ncbi:MAG: ATP-binding protein [Lachnospiraceae bacterium]